jgi:hypothetical protein
MAASSPIQLDQIETQGDLRLIVVWPRGDGFDGGQVRVADAVAGHLRSACERTLERMNSRDLRAYDPDMHLEQEECLVLADPALVADSPVADIVLPTHPLRLVSSRSLPKRSILLYAVGLALGEERVAFVRKTNPRASARSGRIFAMLGNVLQRVDKPLFSIDDSFDLLVSEDGILALDQRLFELLFKDTPAVTSRIPEWVRDIHSHLPLAGDGADRLAKRCETDGRLRRRIRAIVERDHLKGVTIDDIRDHLRAADLDDADFLDGDQLKLDDEDPFRLVYLLNEDFFVGGLTGTDFRSDRKSQR